MERKRTNLNNFHTGSDFLKRPDAGSIWLCASVLPCFLEKYYKYGRNINVVDIMKYSLLLLKQEISISGTPLPEENRYIITSQRQQLTTLAEMYFF